MKDELIQFIQKVKSNSDLLSLGETAAKAGIIEPILRMLGWDTSILSGEVTLEYPVEDGRIDYCLRANKSSMVFLEAKKPSEDLEKHADQLLDYSFRHGIKLAVLSNGITWSFYLPLTEGKWEHRRFYTIDIIEQDSAEATSRFTDFLSKQNISSGDAIKNAEGLLAGKRRQEIIGDSIAEAWKRIVSEPDSLLLEILSELTTKLSGFQPTEEDLRKFFLQNSDRLLLVPEDVLPEKPTPPTNTPPKIRRETVQMSDTDKIPVQALVPDIIRILQAHGGRARKEQVEQEIFKKYERTFSLPWYQQPVSVGVPRWQHNLAWAKEAAKHRGLLKRPSESGRGIWELTQLGKNFRA